MNCFSLHFLGGDQWNTPNIILTPIRMVKLITAGNLQYGFVIVLMCNRILRQFTNWLACTNDTDHNIDCTSFFTHHRCQFQSIIPISINLYTKFTTQQIANGTNTMDLHERESELSFFVNSENWLRIKTKKKTHVKICSRVNFKWTDFFFSHSRQKQASLFAALLLSAVRLVRMLKRLATDDNRNIVIHTYRHIHAHVRTKRPADKTFRFDISHQRNEKKGTTKNYKLKLNIIFVFI